MTTSRCSLQFAGSAVARKHVFVSSGTRLAVGGELGTGGEGTTYRISGDAKTAVKLYHPASLAAKGKLYERKVSVMVANRPAEANDGQSLAWPTEIVLDASRQFVGFTMPIIDTKAAVKWHNAANPSTRDSDASMPPWLRKFSYRYRVQACRNLAQVVASTHFAGYVIGDLNQQNIFVDLSAGVSLIDLDSIQVPDEMGRVLPCPVAAAGFIAPELMGKDLKLVAREPTSDYFVMALHLYTMLMEGWAPYNATWGGVGDKPDASQRIREGLYVNGGDRRLRRPPKALSDEVLPPGIRNLFLLCFADGARNPNARPSAKHWVTALDEAAKNIKRCSKDRVHEYPSHLSNCPWCERAQQATSAQAFRNSGTAQTGIWPPGASSNRPSRPNIGGYGTIPSGSPTFGGAGGYVPPRPTPAYRKQIISGNVPGTIYRYGSAAAQILRWIRNGVVALIAFSIIGSVANSCGSSSSGPSAGSDSNLLAQRGQNLGCSGEYILILKSLIEQSSFESDIAQSLRSSPSDARYLRTDQSCSSFAQSSSSGGPIYAVYLGPFSSPAAALARCAEGPSDSYVKPLTSDGSVVSSCAS